MPDYWTDNLEDLGTRLSSFDSEYKMEKPPFQSFHKEEIGEL